MTHKSNANTPQKPDDEILDIIKERYTLNEEGVVVARYRYHSTAPEAGQPVGSDNGGGYLTTRVLGKQIRLHHLSWYLNYGHWPESCVNHIDLDKTNNTIKNLELVSNRENTL